MTFHKLELGLPADLASNSSFSPSVPGLQLAMDSTSLSSFKECPRKYYYNIVWGYQTREENPHFVFGILVHGARERYDHIRVSGASHDDALDQVLDWALRATWVKELGRPWISGHASKNRLSLIRTIVWYLDKFGQNDPVETVILKDGKPAVELSFRYDSRIKSSAGASFVLCGHFDRIGKLGDVKYIIDAKTTAYALDSKFFSQFTPHNQFSNYTLAGLVVFEEPVKGVLVDGIQVGATFTRFQREYIARDQSQLDEWLQDASMWLEMLDQCAVEQYWPQNEASCFKYGPCPYLSICAKPAASRQLWLNKNYTRRMWDPLQRRGDI